VAAMTVLATGTFLVEVFHHQCPSIVAAILAAVATDLFLLEVLHLGFAMYPVIPLVTAVGAVVEQLAKDEGEGDSCYESDRLLWGAIASLHKLQSLSASLLREFLAVKDYKGEEALITQYLNELP
jgi:hypothetical protein